MEPFEFDAVEENNYLRWSGERALKVDAHRGWGIGIFPGAAHVFAGEEFQITGCDGEHISDGTPENGIAPGYDAAIGRTFCEVLESRRDADVGIIGNIYLTEAMS